MNVNWGKFGGQMGVGFCVLGFLLIFVAWNGAAGRSIVESQFPFLISGGIGGLCLVVIGVGIMIVQNQRADRALLQSTIAELREAIERMGAGSGAQSEAFSDVLAAQAEAAGLVVAGPTTYHRPTCRLLEGRAGLPTMTREDATGRGLHPCRTCGAADVVLEAEPVSRRPARRRTARAR